MHIVPSNTTVGFLQTNNCQSAPQYVVPLQQTLLYIEASVLRAEGPQGGRLWLYPNPMPLRLHTHTHTHTQWIYIMAHFLACLLLCVHSLCFSSTTVALLLWLICAQFFIITQSREAARISEQNQRSSTSKFVFTAVAIHHRQQALRSPQHT